MSARSDLRAAGVRCQPIAFGMTKWGPIPGTQDSWILWDGPGAGLTSYHGDPEKPGAVGQQIAHPTANKAYGTVGEAEKAVAAFIAVYLKDADL